MKRNFLEQLGLDKEVIDKIMAENGKDIEAAKGELENVNAELKAANTTIAERDKQLSQLQQRAEGNEELTKQIADLQAQNKAAADAHAAEITKLKISNAVDKALTAAKARTPKAVRAMLDLNNVKIDKEGNVTGIDEQLKVLTEGEDTKYLFESAKPEGNGTFTGIKPNEGTGSPNGGISNGAAFAQRYNAQYAAKNGENN